MIDMTEPDDDRPEDELSDADEWDVIPGLSIPEFEALSARDPDELTDEEREMLEEAKASIDSAMEAVRKAASGVVSSAQDTIRKYTARLAEPMIRENLPELDAANQYARSAEEQFNQMDFTPAWIEPMQSVRDDMKDIARVALIQKELAEAANKRAEAAEKQAAKDRKIGAWRDGISLFVAVSAVVVSVILGLR